MFGILCTGEAWLKKTTHFFFFYSSTIRMFQFKLLHVQPDKSFQLGRVTVQRFDQRPLHFGYLQAKAALCMKDFQVLLTCLAVWGTWALCHLIKQCIRLSRIRNRNSHHLHPGYSDMEDVSMSYLERPAYLLHRSSSSSFSKHSAFQFPRAILSVDLTGESEYSYSTQKK